MCITGDRNDFIGKLDEVPGAKVTGIVNQLNIKGKGIVKWSVLNSEGKLCPLVLPAYYIPSVKQRLLSTSALCKTYPDGKITVDSLAWIVTLDEDSAPIDVHINPVNNLPTLTGYKSEAVVKLAEDYTKSMDTTHSSNLNLSEPQKELVRWHNRLGHMNFRTIQFLMRSGALASTQSLKNLHTRAAKLLPSDFPKCAACLFGKQTSRPVPGQVSKTAQERAGILSAECHHPGQRVFIDHFMCSTREAESSLDLTPERIHTVVDVFLLMQQPVILMYNPKASSVLMKLPMRSVCLKPEP